MRSMTRLGWCGCIFACLICVGVSCGVGGADFSVLKPGAFAHYAERFNSMDEETVTNLVPNAKSGEWLVANVPLFECPDRGVEELYYFRWWTFRKHIVQTADGLVVTEFLTPVGHAGK